MKNLKEGEDDFAVIVAMLEVLSANTDYMYAEDALEKWLKA